MRILTAGESHGEYYDASTDARITFTGWTNHPELIVYILTEDEALQYAKEFSNDLRNNLILLDENYSELKDHEYGCEIRKEISPKYPLKIITNKKVIGGIPYYVSAVGMCLPFEDDIGLGMFSTFMLHQNAVNGTDIFIQYAYSEEG